MRSYSRLSPFASRKALLSRSESRLSLLALGAALLLSAAAYACNVPVFRFALERWHADAYRVVVFHRGQLSDAEREMLNPLEEQIERLSANLTLRTVDVSELEPATTDEAAADREFLSQVTNAKFPCIVVEYPAYLRIPKPVWMGPLDPDAAGKIIDSPARQVLVQRLAAGQTAVWILLESGDAAQDDAAALVLESELKNLEKSLELPVLTASPDDALATKLPLEVKFSLLRLPRASAAESTLVGMLLGSEPDLVELSQPMVFPVFGRGRALLPLVGAGITQKNIHDAAEFLAGPCSCEVKEQNPGFDLLLKADWRELLGQDADPLVPAQAEPPAEPELVAIPSGSTPSPTATPPTVTSTARASAITTSTAPVVTTRSYSIPIAGLAAVVVLVLLGIGGLVAIVQLGASGEPRS